jgi:predicted nucleotide-binding protein
MLPSERIELAIYRYVNVQGTERSTEVTLLATTVDSTIPLVIERLKGLHLAGHIKLSKYIVAVEPVPEVARAVQRVLVERREHPFHRIPYCEEGNIFFGPEDFFTQRDFIIEITPEGRRYFEQLEKEEEDAKPSVNAGSNRELGAARERSMVDALGTGAPQQSGGRIFIGHGESRLWKDLKDFLSERLRLEWDEFNREPAAGLSTKERLQTMLTNAAFAFLIMTAEDVRLDGTVHARENVIHESGLFQGRLGFERAIILLEEGCNEFSNIHGLTQIRFPRGNIRAVFEEIRLVLEREGILPDTANLPTRPGLPQNIRPPHLSPEYHLPAEELVILAAAEQHGGEILRTRFDQTGEFLKIGPHSFPPDLNDPNPSTEAVERWLNGFRSLLTHDFVRHDGGIVYKITVRGYEFIKESKQKTPGGATLWDALTQCLRELATAQDTSQSGPELAATHEKINQLTSRLLQLAAQYRSG